MQASGLKDINAYNWQRNLKDGRVVSVDAYTKFLMLAVSKFTIMDPAGGHWLKRKRKGEWKGCFG
jgi:hypothetical protein